MTDELITDLLHRWADGDLPAGERLYARVYDELRAVARKQRQRWHGDDTLETTALVHEVYLRLSGSGFAAKDRAHFYAITARATRQVLSNYARRYHTKKRGVGDVAISLEHADPRLILQADQPHNTLDRLWDLECAMQQLHELHPRPCQVVECRYFGGLSIPDTAIALGISEATVKRDWSLAQAWLYRALHHHAADNV